MNYDTPITRARLTRHEAAHAAAAITQGLDVTRVIINGQHNGRTDFTFKGKDGERKAAIATLLARLEDGTEGWPPPWPLPANPRPGDEHHLAVHIKTLGLDRDGYHQLLRDAHNLWSTPAYARLHRQRTEALTHHDELTEPQLRHIAQQKEFDMSDSHDIEGERDADGTLSDRAIDAIIARMHAPTTNTVVLNSSNGHTPTETAEREAKMLNRIYADVERERHQLTVKVFTA